MNQPTFNTNQPSKFVYGQTIVIKEISITCLNVYIWFGNGTSLSEFVFFKSNQLQPYTEK